MDRKKIRLIFQLIFLGAFLYLITGLIKNDFHVAHQFCPMASVCFGVMGASPSFMKFLFLPAIIVGLLIAISTIFLGRKFCAYVCPFGTLQELVHMLNPNSCKINKRGKLPKAMHNALSKVKYLILIFIIISAFFSVQFLYMKFCPVLAVSHPQNITIAAILSLFVILILGFFIERFWCRYFCPYAGLMNIFQKIGSLLKIKRLKINRNLEVCIDCYLCNKNCPMQIDLLEKEIVEDLNCIHCLRCLDKCPKNKALCRGFK